MPRPPRVPILILAATLFYGAAGAGVAASPRETISARTSTGFQLWSEPATWGGRVPVAGADVTIPSSSRVILDVSPPALGGLQIDGTLTFARKDLDLSAKWIAVHGALRVGSPKEPFLQDARITLTDTDRNADIMGMGTRVLGIMGGRLSLHGAPVAGWTRLGATAQRGSRELKLSADMAWQEGDRIVIAPTGYWRQHDEERTITRIDGRSIQLDKPLEHQHWGELQTFDGRTVDERAEVGLLSRNIVIRGPDSSNADGFGGHMMVMEGGQARIDGVEFEYMGQRNRLRRYPVHFHMDGDAKGSYLKRSSIHHSFNRCVTVHGTTRLLVKGNVCFSHPGHGFFLEDGAETDNVIANNLGLGTRDVENGLLPSDDHAATFWITNPDNIVKNNVAAGSDSMGFWYALPEHPTGLSEISSIWPRRTPLGVFRGNVAHSNGNRGLEVDHGPQPNGETHNKATWYEPVSDPSDTDSEPVVARFEDFTAYMNRDRGIWLRGANHVVTGAVLADNRAGATFASEESFLENSFVIGETSNKGTTEEWEDTGPQGRSLPFFWEPETPIVGFEFYDGRVGVSDTTFVGFNRNPIRESGALSYLSPNAFAIHPKNFSRSVRFIDANPVYMAPPEAGMDGDLSKVFVDADGSLTGTPGGAVVANNPFLVTPACEYRSAWNAHVCESDYVSFMAGTLTNDLSVIKPVTLTRSDGVKQSLMGCCDDSDEAWTSVIPNRSYDLKFNGSTLSKFRFVLWRGRGRWIDISVPVIGTPKVTRWGYPLRAVQSVQALDGNESVYYYDAAASRLHLRLSGHKSEWEEIRVEPR